MQISRELISLGGKQNKIKKKPKPEACLLPTAIPKVARSPPAPAATPVLAGRGSAQPACALAAVGGCFYKRCPHPKNNKPPPRGRGSAGSGRAARRAAAVIASRGSAARGGSALTPGACAASPSRAVLGAFLSFSTSSWFLCC